MTEDKKKSNAGRPPLFKTDEELQGMITKYFEQDNIKPTITGLALFLGFCDRHSFYDYEKREEFSHTIKRARALIETVYETLLHSNSCTGAIFALKNFGWKDKTEVDQTMNFKGMPTIKKNGKEIKIEIGDDDEGSDSEEA
jgi:hypothetical protein